MRKERVVAGAGRAPQREGHDTRRHSQIIIEQGFANNEGRIGAQRVNPFSKNTGVRRIDETSGKWGHHHARYGSRNPMINNGGKGLSWDHRCGPGDPEGRQNGAVDQVGLIEGRCDPHVKGCPSGATGLVAIGAVDVQKRSRPKFKAGCGDPGRRIGRQ